MGNQVNIKRIVDALQEMQCAMKEIVRQLQSGDFFLTEDVYKEMKEDYLAMAITAVDIVNGGAAYLFDKSQIWITSIGKQIWSWSISRRCRNRTGG